MSFRREEVQLEEMGARKAKVRSLADAIHDAALAEAKTGVVLEDGRDEVDIALITQACAAVVGIAIGNVARSDAVLAGRLYAEVTQSVLSMVPKVEGSFERGVQIELGEQQARRHANAVMASAFGSKR